MVLEESGYTDMWQKDRSADAAGRLENLKELVRSMEEFPDLQSFLEHVSLVMDANDGDTAERVSLMTLHAAKGLEFDTVFLPGWEEGLFPNQRALDESGRAGLEEERRLAHVGLTRARRTRQDLFRLEPAHPRPVELDHAEPLHRRVCPRPNVEVVEAPANFSSWRSTAAARASTACERSAARPTRRPAGSARRRARGGETVSTSFGRAGDRSAARC